MIDRTRRAASPLSVRVLGCVLLAALTVPAIAQSTSSTPPRLSGSIADVDPMIGTGGDPEDGSNVFPGAAAPFGMTQLSPETEDHGLGYYYVQKWLKGFSMTHMSGAGCANEGEVFFTATTGPPTTQVKDMQTPYSHQRETAEAGYYAVDLLQWNIRAELTATPRTGVARFTFPAGQPANVLVPISHTLNQTESAALRIVGDRRIEGYVENHAFCNKPGTYKVYFVMAFDRPFTSFGTWSGDEYGGPGRLAPDTRSASQSAHDHTTGGWVNWPAQRSSQSITVRIGISYVDLEGAARNLDAEAANHSFDDLRAQAQQSWSRELDRIQVSGGSRKQKRVFYTALYHCLLMPSVFSDVDGRYLGFDQKVHTVRDGHPVYTNFSGWDIYRSEIPLLAILEPARMQDMAQSVVLMYQQGGWFPRWPQINLYTNDMVGSPLSIALATTWLDGLHGFDIETAWQGMFQDATQPPPPGKPYIGEEGIEWLNQFHYLPIDKVDYGSVAKTLEYTLAYASLSRLAEDLHKNSAAATLRERALYGRNLFDAASGFFRPRLSNGAWPKDFNPALDGAGFVEGTAWHYFSFAPADMNWLVGAMGRERFRQRMDDFFSYPLPGWYAQYYNPLNESDLQAPYGYHFSGEPWKSERAVERILSESYLDTPDGIPGNDDLGATSAWAVLSMMGIYSVDPTSLAYELTAPAFSRVTLRLDPPYPAREFTITAEKAAPGAYIHAVTVNGQPHWQNWIPFETIRTGSTVRFELQPGPDKSWGSLPGNAPPSLGQGAESATTN
jgi:predicted alpha-1,2-mannosidase